MDTVAPATAAANVRRMIRHPWQEGWDIALDVVADALGVDDEDLKALVAAYDEAVRTSTEDGGETYPAWHYPSLTADERFQWRDIARRVGQALGLSAAIPAKRKPGGWLYKCFDDQGRLSYVGVGRNPEGRWKAHREAWGEQAIAHCVKVREYADYATLRAAETALIAELLPPLNHNEVDR